MSKYVSDLVKLMDDSPLVWRPFDHRSDYPGNAGSKYIYASGLVMVEAVGQDVRVFGVGNAIAFGLFSVSEVWVNGMPVPTSGWDRPRLECAVKRWYRRAELLRLSRPVSSLTTAQS